MFLVYNFIDNHIHIFVDNHSVSMML